MQRFVVDLQRPYDGVAEAFAAPGAVEDLVLSPHLGNSGAMERTIELEVLPAARHYGIGLLPWSPLAGGLLAGALAKATGGRRGDESAMLGHSAREQRIAEHRPSLEQYEALAADLDVTPTALALGWLLSRPGVTAPVLGPRTLEQLTGSFPALDITIDEQTSSKLDDLFPGPGGEAPDAYTWS